MTKITLLFFHLKAAFITLLLLSGCTQKIHSIDDLESYPQSGEEYAKQYAQLDSKTQQKLNKAFDKRHFSVWHQKRLKTPKTEAFWGFEYEKATTYFYNHQKIPTSWFKEQRENSLIKNYSTLNQKAIVLKNSSLKVFPTEDKLFFDPNKPGEGFPFDYNQNSGIKVNTPILISHYSEDRIWAFVESAYTTGWIKVENIVKISDSIQKQIEKNPLYIAIKDDFYITKNSEPFLKIKLGTIFTKTTSGFILVEKSHNKAQIKIIDIPSKYVAKKPLAFNQENLTQTINELIKEPYGWGENESHRDCSALTRDFVSLYGLYLNRNSKAQLKNGRTIDLKGLNNEEKKALILKKGKPLLTLLYLKGHIVLYVGSIDKEPMIFHNVWGVPVYDFFVESRYVIGQAVITTLEPGKELWGFIPKKSILNRLEKMVILDEKPANEH